MVAHSYFVEEELGSDEAKEALALLRLVATEDAPAQRVLLGLGDSTGRSEAYRRLREHCHVNSCSVSSILARISGGEKLGLTIPALVKRYELSMRRVVRLTDLELPDLVDDLFPADEEKLSGLREAAIEILEVATDARDLLEHVIERITQDDVPQQPDFVRVMSLHKSKGLTSRSVHVAGAAHGILPTLRSNDPALVDAATSEGRRLFYVAVTRASEELVISSSLTMDVRDATSRGVIYDSGTIRKVAGRLVVKTIASPYVGELGPSVTHTQPGSAWLATKSPSHGTVG